MEPLGNRNIREGYGVCGHADRRGQLGAGRGCPRVTGRLSQRVLASGVWGEKAAGQRSPSLVSDISCPGVLLSNGKDAMEVGEKMGCFLERQGLQFGKSLHRGGLCVHA